MAELKPCPFCGSRDIRQNYYDPFDGYQGDFGFYRNKCAGCGCELKASRVEDVNNAWDRRAEDGNKAN